MKKSESLMSTWKLSPHLGHVSTGGGDRRWGREGSERGVTSLCFDAEIEERERGPGGEVLSGRMYNVRRNEGQVRAPSHRKVTR